MISVLHGLDTDLFLFLNSFHARWLNGVMEFLSGQVVWLPLVFFFIYSAGKNLSRRNTYLFCLFLFLTLVVCDVSSSYLLKNIFERLRPCRLAELKPLINSFGQKCGGKYGFVSSHAANSVALIHLSLRTLPLRSSAKHLFYLAPVLVGYSRIYLGVHYPGDILGGALVGVFWGSILAWIFNRSTERV